jgi:hypothetical protein
MRRNSCARAVGKNRTKRSRTPYRKKLRHSVCRGCARPTYCHPSPRQKDARCFHASRTSFSFASDKKVEGFIFPELKSNKQSYAVSSNGRVSHPTRNAFSLLTLWWNVALPQLNPFGALYNHLVAKPKGLPAVALPIMWDAGALEKRGHRGRVIQKLGVPSMELVCLASVKRRHCFDGEP